MDAGLPPGEIIELDEGPGEAPGSATLADPFRHCMRLLAGGVAIVTAGRPGARVGLTATSVTSLSMSPPSLLVSVRAGATFLPVALREERFTVHLLEETQAREADVFAGRSGDDRPRTDQVNWGERAGGRLAGALCHVECRLARVVPIFSHVILVGGVEAVEIGEPGRPLLYFGGLYRKLADDAPGQA